MDSEMLPNDHPEPFSIESAREFLREICEATRDAQERDVFEFCSLVDQVIDLHDESDDEQQLAGFIRDGIEEIQRLVNDDQPNSERLESLRGQAIDCWGDFLSSADETLDDVDPGADAWGSNEDDLEAFDLEDDEELVAPSAEEISSLLGQLGSVPTADEATEEPKATDPSSGSSCDPSQHETSHGQSSGQHTGPDHQLPDQREPSSAEATTQPTSGDPGTTEATAAIAGLEPELREAFLDDASSCISSMEDSLLKLENDPGDADALNQICRELHTLKGASGSVGLADLASQVHELEDRLRDDHAAGRAPEIGSLLKSVDAIRSQISSGPASGSTQSSNDSVAAALPEASALASPMPSLADFNDGANDDEMVRVKSSQLNRLMDMLAELVMLRNRRETELSDLQEVYHELIGSVSKMRLLSNEGSVISDACTSLQLSEVANDVLEVAQHVRDCARPVAEGNTAVSQFIRQFRQELVALRRTPVSGLFRRLQRVVRDAANSEGKDVRLQLIGEDAGIERSLQQRLYEPLLHIVRNSVSHGIEHPEDRTKSGKPSSGTITIEARSGPDLFVIEIRDDGKGLDYDAIRRRAVESGLLASDEVASREELSQLIFHPGFSTRQTANQVAGRGVGMDVVATTIQRMRGWLEIDSIPHQGTRIRLSFPLPSVIQHAMVFRSAGQLFALPMQSVRSFGESERAGVCLSFSEILGCPPAETSQHIVLACESPSATGDDETSSVTLVVDEVIGPEEVVVRPLPTLLRQHPFCSGATLSGMGRTVLFLDARRLVETRVRDMEDGGAAASQKLVASNAASRKTVHRSRVLVVDDSLSARKRVVRSLRRYPVDITEACDGKQALEILKKQRFDVIFSDMEMPHVDGMELLTEVNSPDRQNPPPVVIISSRNEDQFTSRAKELGAVNYLSKPLADEALDRAISGIPSLSHLETESSIPLQMSGVTHDR